MSNRIDPTLGPSSEEDRGPDRRPSPLVSPLNLVAWLGCRSKPEGGLADSVGPPPPWHQRKS